MKNMSITRKLQLGIATLVLLTALGSTLNYFATRRLQVAYNEFKILNEANRHLNTFISLLTNNTLGYMDAIVDKDSGDVDASIVKKHQEFKDWTQANKEVITRDITYINKNFKVEEFFQQVDKYWNAGESMIKEIKNKKVDELDKYDNDIDSINEALVTEITKNLKLSDNLFTNASKEVEAAQTIIANTTIYSLISMIIIGISISVYIMKSITASLEKSGSRLNTGTEVVLNSSRDFSELGNRIKDSTNKQASSLQESVSAIDQIKATVDRNAELSTDSVKLAETCVDFSQIGKKSIEEMIQAVSLIEKGQQQTNQMLETTSSEIQEMVAVIKGIGAKTDVINDIVFQTKLLSFNASVEAARAGEHGKGFAVVAEEVGNLAAMSGNAAREINELLSGSITKVESIVKKTQQNTVEINHTGNQNIETGTRTAQNCNAALDDIYENVTRMKEMIREINSSSKEQASGIGSIQTALVELDNITNDNVISAEKCASSAEKLNTQSQHLKSSVVDLIAEIMGKSA